MRRFLATTFATALFATGVVGYSGDADTTTAAPS